MYCIRARSSNTNSNNAKKQWIRWGQLYTHIPHLLFIERADWPKLHEMFKTRDARIRRRFQIRVWVFFVDAWLKPNFCHAHELIRPLDTGKKITIRNEPLTHFIRAPFEGNNTSDGMFSWWRHQIETFSALLAICEGNSPVTKASDAELFFYLRLNKQLSKQSWGWWFETPSRSLWRQRNVHERQLDSPVVESHIFNWTCLGPNDLLTCFRKNLVSYIFIQPQHVKKSTIYPVVWEQVWLPGLQKSVFALCIER